MVEETKIPEGYKKTEVGVIPEDWEIRKLGDDYISYIDSDNLSSSTDLKYEFNYISLEYIDNGKMLGYSECTFETAPSRARRRITEEDIMVSTVRPNLKSHYLFKEKKGNWICSTGFSVIRANKKNIIPAFIYFNLFFTYINRQIERLIAGSNYPAISGSDVKNMTIPIPPITEQKAIATALTDVDNLITSLEKLIDKKEKIKQGTMQQLLTGKKRLPGFSGEWELIKIKDIINYTKGFAFKSSEYRKSGIRIIRVSDTTYDSIKSEDAIYIDSNSLNKYKKWVLSQNDLILSTVGSKPPMYDSMVGKVIKVDYENEGSLLNQNAIKLCDKNGNINTQLILYYNLKTKTYLNHIEKIFRGNANQASITLKELFEFEIHLPTNKEEQQAIAQILRDMDSEIKALKQKLQKYKTIKQGMMQELLTGRVRLV
ncbi:restriction endonuclease subunit S [Clostridium formicaceticum]|uniref:Type-1 restriction enzyme EcoKI specificity protein n=1 Tax=Clostridium formicaceticum TaxID=1497 RepID=A0AAC9RKS9_9CLOT|nr:restriction endonuclease subunit S [Clostridium formicaceticum]AOY74698.1 hypothetical protein BJL90_01250 [Clostridium formicaceticum]ARE89076.1 Type-1 restriction enzyme EcoKI specificity protein [Clostridium formicaceticum]